MSPRICECGRAIILRPNRRRSRPRYRHIKGHELCRKCNESLKDRIWSRWTAERTRTAIATTGAAMLGFDGREDVPGRRFRVDGASTL